MSPRGNMYTENSRGPKTEPCGTPELTLVQREVVLLNETEWVLSDR